MEMLFHDAAIKNKARNKLRSPYRFKKIERAVRKGLGHT